jgi:DNA/RNA-binding domain of Phe-tRNA-synthetase-like protein
MLRFGKAGDEIHLLGDEKPTEYKATEIGYFDKKGGYNLDYNYRDSERTAVTTDTTDMLINVDGISEISPETVEEVLREAITTVTKYCGGKVEIAGIVK